MNRIARFEKVSKEKDFLKGGKTHLRQRKKKRWKQSMSL